MERIRTPELPWDDEAWAESDTEWARGCRLLQGWWRSQLDGGKIPAGLSVKRGSRPAKLVVSMLAEPDWRRNFLTDDALHEFRHWSKSGSGLMDKERARRNLLSSQPLAFNLFGPFVNHPAPLLSWVRTIDPDADAVADVRLEWAPHAHQTFGGGSAFDVFIQYEARSASRFLGIESKYAEDLAKSSIKSIRHFTYPDGPHMGQRPPSYEKYERYTTTSGLWEAGAADRLDISRLRQFWLNTMLAQRLVKLGSYESGTSVVVSCQDDEAAWAATTQVRAELVDANGMHWAPYEALLGTLHQLDWASAFTERYLDFAPVTNLLAVTDPRRRAGH